jgi:PHP family Zn ribbon phosphoesterase
VATPQGGSKRHRTACQRCSRVRRLRATLGPSSSFGSACRCGASVHERRTAPPLRP